MAIFEPHTLHATDEALSAYCRHALFDTLVATGENGDPVLLRKEAVDVGDDLLVLVLGQEPLEFSSGIDFALKAIDRFAVHAQVSQLTFETAVLVLQASTLKSSDEEAFGAVEDAGGEARNGSADDAYDLVDEADAALSSGIALEQRKADRYAKEDKQEEAILIR